MNHVEFKRLLKEFAPAATVLKEADITPIGPDGNKITDETILANLNMAVKAVSSGLRPKLIQILEDPEAAKSLRSPAQRAALIGAIAIAFGVSEKEFGQIVAKIKGMLKSTETNDQA